MAATSDMMGGNGLAALISAFSSPQVQGCNTGGPAQGGAQDANHALPTPQAPNKLPPKPPRAAQQKSNMSPSGRRIPLSATSFGPASRDCLLALAKREGFFTPCPDCYPEHSHSRYVYAGECS